MATKPSPTPDFTAIEQDAGFCTTARHYRNRAPGFCVVAIDGEEMVVTNARFRQYLNKKNVIGALHRAILRQIEADGSFDHGQVFGEIAIILGPRNQPETVKAAFDKLLDFRQQGLIGLELK